MTVLFAGVGLLLYKDLHAQGEALLSEPVLTVQTTRVMPAHRDSNAAEPPHFIQQTLNILHRPWPRVLLLIATIEGAAGFGMMAICASHLHDKLGHP